MRATRFFRIVGRINALLILAILLFAGLALLADLAGDASRHLRRYREEAKDGAKARPPEEDRLELQSPVAIEGTALTVLPLGGEGEASSFSSGSDEAAGTRNLLFHDAASGRMRWLRPDDKAAIRSWEVVREGQASSPAGAVEEGQGIRGGGAILGLRYEIAEADTDGDGVVTGADRLQVGLSAADGEGYAAVLRDVDEVLGYSAPSGGKLAVFFRRAGEERVAEIDLRARRSIREVALPAR